MRCMRATGFRVHHQFAVSVIRRNDHCPSDSFQRLDGPTKAFVNGLAGFDCRREVASVADHIGIGIIYHNHVIAAANRLDEFVGDFAR